MTVLWRRDDAPGFGPADRADAPGSSAGGRSAAPAAAAVESLLAELEELPAARPVVVQTLRLIDDPDCSSQQLAMSAGSDVALTGKLLRLANSAFYGLSGRVTSLPFAITVVGFETVRAIAVAALTDLSHDPQQLPENFWTAAALTAVAAGAVAGQVGARQPEAFCAGLLADLGTALLFRADPECYRQLPDAPIETRLAAELQMFGVTHPKLGQRALEAWQLPRALAAVVGAHHDPVAFGEDPLRLAYAAGHEIAGRILREPHTPTSLAVLTRGAVSEDAAAGLIANVRTQAEPLIECLTSGE